MRKGTPTSFLHWKAAPISNWTGVNSNRLVFFCVLYFKMKMFLTDKSKQKDHSYQICLHTFQVQLHWLSCRSLNSPIRLNIMQIFHVDTARSGSQMCKILGPDSTNCSPLWGSKNHGGLSHLFERRHWISSQSGQEEPCPSCGMQERALEGDEAPAAPLSPVFSCSPTAF